MRLWYPYRIEPDDGQFSLIVRDFPQVHHWGDTPEEVESHTTGAVEAGVSGAMKARVQIPLPSTREDGDTGVAVLSTLTGMKVMIWNAMLTRDISKSALARAMDVQPNQVDRIIDIDHNTSVEQLDRAAQALRLAWDIGLSDRATFAGAARGDVTYGPHELLRALALTALNNDPDRELRDYFWRALTEWNNAHAQNAISP